ncbi:unnamed protein product [Caenorhabditis sp. 36 PRJEB53466]|nr:unnamed protein product [Caenorhabditis sp. 36 PRJEB53466]
MEPLKSIIGIVVGRDFDPQKYYVWSNETYVGRDGMILVPFGVRVDLGDWLVVSFGPIQAATFFPSQKSEHTPRFESSDFRVIRAIYETTPIGKTVQIKLNQCLTAGQTVIEHHFFKKIYNDTVLVGDGDWNLTIRRVEPRVGYGRESVWILDRVASIPERPKTGKDVIGIVVGTKNASENYVWCKETRPGLDGTIVVPDSGPLPSGTWVRMSFTQQEVDVYFENEQEIRFKSWNYSVMTEIYETEPMGLTIDMKLKCFIAGLREARDIYFHFVGLIHNKTVFELGGKYEITIRRGYATRARDGVTWSVWYLYNFKAIRVCPQPAQLLPSPLMLPPLPSLPRRPHFTAIIERLQSPPPPAAQPSPKPVMAIITRIEKKSKTEHIYCWLFDKHSDAKLHMKIEAWEMNLREGSTISAVFTLTSEDKYLSEDRDVKKVETGEYCYETRDNGDGIDVRMCSNEHKLGDESDTEARALKCPVLYHAHFGNVLDKDRMVKMSVREKMHMWIRRFRVKGTHRWVVVESIAF